MIRRGDPPRSHPPGVEEGKTVVAYEDFDISKSNMNDVAYLFFSFEEKDGHVRDEEFPMKSLYTTFIPFLSTIDKTGFWSGWDGEIDDQIDFGGATNPNEVVVRCGYGTSDQGKPLSGRCLLRAHDIHVSKDKKEISLSITASRMKFDAGELPPMSMDILDDDTKQLAQEATWHVRFPLPEQQTHEVFEPDWDAM